MRDAAITLPFAGAQTRFRVGLAEIEAMQESRDAGPSVLLDRLAGEDWTALDVLAVLAQGSGQPDATQRALRGLPLRSQAHIAMLVMVAANAGAADETIESRRPASADGQEDALPNGKIRFATVYGNGAAMGFSPQEVRAMSLWQFFAACSGYQRANDPEAGKRLSESEADALWDWIDQ